jgi:ATP-dependent DNA helicase RecG
MPSKLSQEIKNIPKIGPAYQARLEHLGIKTVKDLLYHFPTRYEDFSTRINIADLKVEETACVQGIVESVKMVRVWKRHLTITEIVISDETGKVKALWFNQPYLAGTFKKGLTVCLAGKLVEKKSSRYLSNPMYEKVNNSEDNEIDLTHTGRLVPIYPQTAGLSSRWLRYVIKPLLNSYADLPDPLPEATITAYEFMPWREAVKQIHFPENLDAAAAARKRFAFEELFFIQLSVLRERIRLNNERAEAIALNLLLIQDFTKNLPFQLTEAQRVSSYRILKDMEKNRPMNRLLQGDVGSGKTIVAMMAALNAAKAGYQTAFMVPTEILATQHYETFRNFLKPFGVETGILCAKNTALSSFGQVSKSTVLELAKNGKIGILIGTNALIQKGVAFKKLAFVILDEQHRFGVDQRAALAKNNQTKKKEKLTPHLLSMTATPIPRSLALTIYGDLDLTLLDEMPKGRKIVETKIVKPDGRAAAYEFIRQEIKNGRQAFMVCPRIEADEEEKRDAILFDPKADYSGAEAVKAVKVEYEKLSEEIFPDLRVGMLHGKMKAVEKREIMNKFKQGLIDILVSTSVIEVGIDIPNASIMAIEGSHKFGLAQLHQFRGRVGRGAHQSYCLLFSDYPTRRLNALLKYDNGFELAEKDLEIRGPGEVFGSQQWGMPDLVMASLADVFLVEKSRNAAKGILARDPTLENHPRLLERVKQIKQRTHLE